MVDALAQLPAQRRIVVAGEMLELGPAGGDMHRDLGGYIAEKADLLYGVRGLAEKMVEGARERGSSARFFPTPEAAGEALAAEVRPGDVILFKASRGVKLESALDALQARLNQRAGGTASRN